MSEIYEGIQKLKEFEADIISRALEDDDFRKRLLDDPKKLIEQESGKPLPEALKIRVIEEEMNSLTLVLPRAPKAAGEEGELSEEALEKVAGGAGAAFVVTTVTQFGIVAEFVSSKK